MAKKEKKELTVEDKIARAEQELLTGRGADMNLLPAPTRFFEIGDKVRVGNLDDVVIVKKIQSGLAYVYSCTKQERGEAPRTVYQANVWFDVKSLDLNADVPSLFSKYQTYPCLVSDLFSIMHFASRGGLVSDIRYQRDYVWTEADKDALIESVFDRLDIGSFLFVRNAGYRHKEGSGSRTYRTLDGKLVEVERRKDDAIVIIDGQQRLTTLLQFVFDIRPYKGLYFSKLNWKDQHEFYNKALSYRIMEEYQVSEKEIVRMFLQANRGVPQTPEHLAKVQALYESMD